MVVLNFPCFASECYIVRNFSGGAFCLITNQTGMSALSVSSLVVVIT